MILEFTKQKLFENTKMSLYVWLNFFYSKGKIIVLLHLKKTKTTLLACFKISNVKGN